MKGFCASVGIWGPQPKVFIEDAISLGMHRYVRTILYPFIRPDILIFVSLATVIVSSRLFEQVIPVLHAREAPKLGM